MDVLKQKVVLQPSRTIPLQFSNHTTLRYRKADYRVVKVLKLYQNAFILEQAREELEQGIWLKERIGFVDRQMRCFYTQPDFEILNI